VLNAGGKVTGVEPQFFIDSELQYDEITELIVTKDMAEAINNTPAQKFEVLKQQIHNNAEALGSSLLPTVNNTLDKINDIIGKGAEWISNNQE